MSNTPGTNRTLSPDDATVLDALIECGFDRSRLPAEIADEPERVNAMVNLLGLLDDDPVEDADETLIDATLAEIEHYERTRRDRMNIETTQETGSGFFSSRRIRLPDFISVAAVLLIVAGITLPIVNRMRANSIQAACANNLRSLAAGFDAYAGDHNGVMPMTAGFGGSVSWRTFNNSDNLELLPRGGYCQLGCLDCPGNHHVGSSYSYQAQLANHPQQWGLSGDRVVVGDRNPLITAVRHGESPTNVLISSPNHRLVGQNVLFEDGSVRWLPEPMVNHGKDNIWLPSSAEGEHGLAGLNQKIQKLDLMNAFLIH